MSRYYDITGKPISLEKWAVEFEDPKKRRVGFTLLPNGYEVSTVFLGLDHNFLGGKPLIFETMVFEKNERLDLDMERYSTLDEAKAGHKKMVAKWRKKKKGIKK
jgi:hypothetical protein